MDIFSQISTTVWLITLSSLYVGYGMWRFVVADLQKGRIKNKVNDFIYNKDNPQEVRELVDALYKRSLKHTMPIKALFGFLKRLVSFKKKNSESLVSELRATYGEEKSREIVRLIIDIVGVNVLLSPFLYFFYGILFIFVCFIIVVFRPLSAMEKILG